MDLCRILNNELTFCRNRRNKLYYGLRQLNKVDIPVDPADSLLISSIKMDIEQLQSYKDAISECSRLEQRIICIDKTMQYIRRYCNHKFVYHNTNYHTNTDAEKCIYCGLII